MLRTIALVALLILIGAWTSDTRANRSNPLATAQAVQTSIAASRTPTPVATANTGASERPSTDSAIDDAVADETEAARHPLDARLGGTVESWQAEFGPPIEGEGEHADLFTEYDIPGYSGIYADEHLGRIESIHLFAPRPAGEEWSNDEPHPMDWTISEAHKLAKQFLPRDAQYGEPDEERISGIMTECYSDSLAVEVPVEVYDDVDNTPVYGGCSYWLDLHLDDESKVTNIIIQLQIEEPLT